MSRMMRSSARFTYFLTCSSTIPEEHGERFPQANARKRETSPSLEAADRSASVVGVQSWKRVETRLVCSSSFRRDLSTRELPTGHRFPERSRADRGAHCFPWSWESKRLQGKQIPRSTRRPEPRSWSNALPIYPLRAFLARSTLPLRFLYGKNYNNRHIY